MSSDYPKLTKRMEHILWEFEKIIHKEIEDGNIEDVELRIGTNSFSPRSSITTLSYSLMESLSKLDFENAKTEQEKETIRGDIKLEHISASEGLIKLGRYQKKAIQILSQALLKGSDSDVKKAALEALSDCGTEISNFDSFSQNEAAYYSEFFDEIRINGETCHQERGSNIACCKNTGRKYQLQQGRWQDIGRC